MVWVWKTLRLLRTGRRAGIVTWFVGLHIFGMQNIAPFKNVVVL